VLVFLYCHVPLSTRSSVIIFRLEFGPSFFLLPRTNNVLLTIPSITLTLRQSSFSPSFPLRHTSPLSRHGNIHVSDGCCACGHFGVPIMQSVRSITTFSSARHLSLSRATSIPSKPLAPTSSFLKITFNIIPPYMLRSSKQSHSLRPPHQNSLCRYRVHCICHVPSQSNFCRYDQPGYLVRGTDH